MLKYRNPRYNANGTIDVELDHPVFGIIPFTASPSDPEKHGRELFEELSKSGNVAPYEPHT